MTQSNTLPSKPTSKKRWLVLFIILGTILLPLVALDIHYRLEFSKYDNEVKRIASYLPAGAVEEEGIPTKRGNGLLGRLDCKFLGFGQPCPAVGRKFLVSINKGEETQMSREILKKVGYEIDPKDLPGTINGDCSIAADRTCFVEGVKNEYSVAIGLASSLGEGREGLVRIVVTVSRATQ